MRLRFSLAALGLLVAVSNCHAQATDEQAKARLDSAVSQLQATLQAVRAEHARVMADARTNSQLWANVNEARLARDSERVAKTERELADYLTRKLESIDKKPYPEGMTLAKVLDYYKNHRLARPLTPPESNPNSTGQNPHP